MVASACNRAAHLARAFNIERRCERCAVITGHCLKLSRVGLFTLPLARRFAHITGIEANCAALNYAQRNLSDAGLANATFECARVGDYLDSHAQKLSPADFVLLDPPRAGVEPAAIGGILALSPQRITYVSCDPATLARDLKELMKGGYKLDSVAAFDMFPQTHHVETIVKLKQ